MMPMLFQWIGRVLVAAVSRPGGWFKASPTKRASVPVLLCALLAGAFGREVAAQRGCRCASTPCRSAARGA
jgi:hypothetical protein